MAVLTGPLKLALTIGVFAAVFPAAGKDVTLEEYQVKAAFLYNFTKFVEWPPEAFTQSDRINICILGNNSFAALVEETVAGKEVGNHGFNVQKVAASTQGRGCHILFISKTDSKRQAALLGDIQDPYALAVGESDEFLANGGVINLTLKDARVRIEINQRAAVRLRCRISSKLFTLANAIRK
ncbi:MAG: YfiR family protein [Acidobacteriota bacterium]